MLSPRLIRLLRLRSFRARPLRALTSILGIILGVAGMLAIAITNQAALTALEQSFSDASGSARLSIIPAGSDEQALPEILVRSAGQQVPRCPRCGSENVKRLLPSSYMIKMGAPRSDSTCCGRAEPCQTPACSEGGHCCHEE